MSEQFVSQVDPAALQKLFNADPENLSDADIETICTELRKMRANFALEEQRKEIKEKKPKAKSVSSAEASQLSLEDLDL